MTYLSDFLRSFSAAQAQTLGNMTIIPLVSREVAPLQLGSQSSLRFSTRSYGHVLIENRGDEPVMVPRDRIIMVKQGAQDHALPSYVHVPAHRTVEVTNAACIQSSQPGTFANESAPIRFLPLHVRVDALVTSHVSGYNKLWASIADFYQTTNYHSHASNLVDYYDAYEGELDQFVPAFEDVPDQRGVIVLVNGVVVGVEIYPSPEHWAEASRAVIRDIYGSFALAVADRTKYPDTRPPFPSTPPTQEQAVVFVSDYLAHEKTAVGRVFREVTNENLNVRKVDESGGAVAQQLLNTNFMGEVITADDKVVYLTVFATHARQTLSPGSVLPAFDL